MIQRLTQKKDRRLNDIEKITKYVNGGGGVIVIYGASRSALHITNYLHEHGIHVSDYFCSDGYQNDSSNVYDGVKTFGEILESYEKIIIVVGNDFGVHAVQTEEKYNDPKIHDIFIWSMSHYIESAMDLEFIEENETEFDAFFDKLADESSRKALIGYLNTKITYDISFLREIYNDKSYFPDGLTRLILKKFLWMEELILEILLWSLLKLEKEKYAKYYAFELEADKIETINKLVQSKCLKNIVSIQKALWNEVGCLRFNSGFKLASNISECGADVVQCDTIDRCAPDATFIKMDIEGSELKALEGAKNTIINNHPKLAICVYHKKDDLLTIPQFILKIDPSYQLYLRSHSLSSAQELVLYAI